MAIYSNFAQTLHLWVAIGTKQESKRLSHSPSTVVHSVLLEATPKRILTISCYFQCSEISSYNCVNRKSLSVFKTVQHITQKLYILKPELLAHVDEKGGNVKLNIVYKKS